MNLTSKNINILQRVLKIVRMIPPVFKINLFFEAKSFKNSLFLLLFVIN